MLLISFFLLVLIIYNFIDNVKNKSIVEFETYYLLNNKTSQNKILHELKSRKINISRIEWELSSLLHNKPFIPKAGEYLITKDLSVFEIQKLFQNGKTITRHFTIVEGSTESELKKKLINNHYLSGDI